MKNDLFDRALRTQRALQSGRLPQYTESQLVALIHQRYEGEAWARLAQVRNGTGHRSVTRTADALVMSLWPSRGLHLYGFECKSSRADWLGELKKPEKAEEIAQYCHYWFLVTAHDQVAKLEEIPATWGWLVPDATGKKLTVLKEPMFKEATPLSYSFLGSLLRNVTATTVPRVTLAEEVRAGKEQLEKQLTERITREVAGELRSTQNAYTNLQTAVERFQSASGLSIHQNTWSWNNKGQTALTWLLNGGLDSTRTEILNTAIRLEGMIQTLREVSTIQSPEPDFSI